MGDVIDEAVTRLRAGELVVVPTETVYGLAADASNADAVAKIFSLKRRPADRPLIVHIADPEGLDRWAARVPELARALVERFWPGPLTIVLDKAADVPIAVTGGLDTVGLRMPSHPLTLELLRRFGGGIAAPSANRYGRISPTTPAHVRAQFGDETPLLLDGGACDVGIESTIVAIVDSTIRVLRAGAITPADLAAATGSDVIVSSVAGLRVPGQDRTHYAPTTPTSFVARDDLDAWAAAHTGRIGYLGFTPPPMTVEVDVRLAADATEAARGLYAALHALDDADLDAIVLEEPADDASWDAVRDRMLRAAGGERWRPDA